MTSQYPEELRYDDKFSWVSNENGIMTVGITQPSASMVSEFVFIQLPEKGKKIRRGDTYVSLESSKWSGHVQSPISGEVIEANEELFDEPSRINKAAYKEWIMKIKPSDMSEYEELMKADEKK
jgi:glycine cleavage system H protein